MIDRPGSSTEVVKSKNNIVRALVNVSLPRNPLSGAPVKAMKIETKLFI